MDKLKIKEYLNSLREINANQNKKNNDKVALHSDLEISEYDSSESNILPDLTNENYDCIEIVTPIKNEYSYDGDSIEITLSNDDLNKILSHYGIDGTKEIDLYLPLESRPISRFDVTITSLVTGNEYISYTNTFPGAVKVDLMSIYKTDKKISIKVQSDGTGIFYECESYKVGIKEGELVYHEYYVKTLPKTVYKEGEKFDSTGLVIVEKVDNKEVIIDESNYNIITNIVDRNTKSAVIKIGQQYIYVKIDVYSYDNLSYKEETPLVETIYNHDKFKIDLNLCTLKKYFTFKGINLIELILKNNALISNLNYKLKKNINDNVTNTIYSLIDPYDNEIVLEEKYYYIENGKKNYVNKNLCKINVDGSIYYNNFKIFKEQSNLNYELIPRIDDYVDSKFINTNSDEKNTLENKIKNYEVNLINYVIVDGITGEIVLRLNELSESKIMTFLSYLTSKSADEFPLPNEDKTKSGNYNIILSFNEALNLKSLYNSYSSYELQEKASQLDEEEYETQEKQLNNQLMSLQDNIDYLAQYNVLKKKGDSQIDGYKKYEDATINENGVMTGYDDVLETEEVNKRLEKLTYLHNKNQIQDSMKNKEIVQSEISHAKKNNEIKNSSKELNEQTGNILIEEIKNIISQAITNAPIIKDNFIEYIKSKKELSIIKLKEPCNYVKHNDSFYCFNEDDNLCAIVKNKKYYQINYENNLIKSILYNNNEIVTLEYDSDKLVNICDKFANKVSLIYTLNQLSEIRYNDKSILFTISNQLDSITDGYKTIELGYDTYINSIKCKINDETIENVVITRNNDNIKIVNALNTSYVSYQLSNNGRLLCKEQKDEKDNLTSTLYSYNRVNDKEIVKIYSTIKNNIILKTIESNIFTKNILMEQVENKANGSVWYKIEKTLYDYDLKNNLIKESIETYINSTSVYKTQITLYYYNNSNKLIKTKSYYKNKNLGDNITEYIYDSNDNLLKEIFYNSLCSSDKTIKEYHYNDDNLIDYSLDNLGLNKTYYEYDNNKLVQVKNPSGLVLGYGYDNDIVTSITRSTSDFEENSSNVIYENGYKVKEISNNNEYSYSYDNKGRLISVKLNNNLICTYSYVDYKKTRDIINLNSITKKLNDGKDTTIKIESKKENDIITETTSVNDSIININTYDKFERLSTIDDKVANIKTIYTYNNYNFVSRISGSIVETYSYTNQKIYRKNYVINGIRYSYGYHYNDNDLISYISMGTYTFNNDYDYNGRIVCKEIYNGTNKISGSKIGYLKNGCYKTSVPNSILYNDGTKLKYIYDEVGNVKEVYEDNILINRYCYDTLGRIIREDNKILGETIIYSYDNNGNVLNKHYYDYTIKSIDDNEFTNVKYKYDNDLLIEVGKTKLNYDMLGRPVGIGDVKLTWDRECLKSYGDNTYNYNSFGLRIKKNNIEYLYDSNGKLVYDSRGITFIYDDNQLAGFKYQDNNYFYRYDLLGNIVKIIDANGNIVVKYEYDSYGNHIVLDDLNNIIEDEKNIGNINPIRYKGYYYDIETKLYYLLSRYYDPKIGRFISPDSLDYLNYENINGLNLYIYCNNNPVMYVDENGCKPKWWQWLISGLMVVGGIVCTATGVAGPVGGALISAGVGSIVNGYINEASGGSFNSGYWGGMISGALTGLGAGISGSLISKAFDIGYMTLSNAARFTGGLLISAIGGFAGNMAGSIITTIFDGGKIDSSYVKKLVAPSLALGGLNMVAGYLSGVSSLLVNEVSIYGGDAMLRAFGISIAMSTEAIYDIVSYYIQKILSSHC